MQRLVIIGAGGHGREVLDVVEAVNAVEPRFDVVGFVADHADRAVLARRGVPHLGGVDDLVEGRLTDGTERLAVVVAVGDPQARRDLVERLTPFEPDWAPALVHPLASLGGDVRLGRGVVVAAGARITTNVRVADHVQVNVNAVVSHDCVVGEHATLSPGVLLNGTVTVGAGVFLGTGAVVTPGHSIGAWSVIGAGAVVVSDVPGKVTAVGVPARWTT